MVCFISMLEGIYIYNCLFINLDCPQVQDFVYGGKRVNNDGYNQGGTNVHRVIEIWLKAVKEYLG